MSKIPGSLSMNIGYDQETIPFEEALTFYKDCEDGFLYPLADVCFKPPELDEMLKDLRKEFPDLTEYNYSRSATQVYRKFSSELVRIYVSGNSIELMGSFYAKTEEDSHKIWAIYDKHTEKTDDVEIFINSFSMEGTALNCKGRNIKPNELEYISERYYPYIDTSVMFDQFFTGNENILLLVGKPGRGKSKLSTLALKYAYQNPDKLPYDKIKDNPVVDTQFIACAFVKSVDVLANDGFWRELEKNPPDFCIIDDLDYMLTKRGSEVMSQDDVTKNSFLNQFLSYTDGVEKNRTKFIITTNQNYDDIDSALLRRGRLFDILELRKLDLAEALDIWEDHSLNREEFHSIFKDPDVLPAELGAEISKRMNDRIENAQKSYLKEEGVSKIAKASASKKIGI